MLRMRAEVAAPIGRIDPALAQITVYDHLEFTLFPMSIHIHHHHYKELRQYFFANEKEPQFGKQSFVKEAVGLGV